MLLLLSSALSPEGILMSFGDRMSCSFVGERQSASAFATRIGSWTRPPSFTPASHISFIHYLIYTFNHLFNFTCTNIKLNHQLVTFIFRTNHVITSSNHLITLFISCKSHFYKCYNIILQIIF